jgi:putative aminopeptidase FrvX
MLPPHSIPNTITRDHMRLLRSLTEVVGVSGDEQAVCRVIQSEIEAYADDLKTDPLGNLLAVRRGRGRSRLKVMCAAHMDEVGFMITEVDLDGFLKFEPVGAVDGQRLLGQSLWIGGSRHLGVIGTRPVHLTSDDERSHKPSIESLKIDIGATSQQAARGRVKPGDRASFATEFLHTGGVLFAKALDDRLGVATLIELLRHAPDGVDLMAAFTVQEEIGQSGARVAAQAFDPDVAIVLEATAARDLPAFDGSENRRYNARFGRGPVIYAADRETVSDPRLLALFTQTAERARLPFQIRQPGGGWTDAASIHLANAGIPCISISVPVRHIHGPVGMARVGDWRDSVVLVHHVLSTVRPSSMRRH